MRTISFLKANNAKDPKHVYAGKFSLYARAKSFSYAWSGIIRFFTTEPQALVHLAASFLVLVLCLLFPVTKTEVMVIIFSVAFVWVTEMINTAIEQAMDFISTERHSQIKAVKDIAAAAVLVSAAAALAVGLLIFIPKIF